MKKAAPWWQRFQVVGYVAGGLIALATAGGVLRSCVIEGSKTLTVNDRVEAAEQKNELQDDAILELKKSNEVWQQIYQQQQSQMQQQYQAPPNARVRNVWEEQNPDGSWWCCDAETSDCNDPYSPPWYRC